MQIGMSCQIKQFNFIDILHIKTHLNCIFDNETCHDNLCMESEVTYTWYYQTLQYCNLDKKNNCKTEVFRKMISNHIRISEKYEILTQ